MIKSLHESGISQSTEAIIIRWREAAAIRLREEWISTRWDEMRWADQ